MYESQGDKRCLETYYTKRGHRDQDISITPNKRMKPSDTGQKVNYPCVIGYGIGTNYHMDYLNNNNGCNNYNEKTLLYI